MLDNNQAWVFEQVDEPAILPPLENLVEGVKQGGSALDFLAAEWQSAPNHKKSKTLYSRLQTAGNTLWQQRLLLAKQRLLHSNLLPPLVAESHLLQNFPLNNVTRPVGWANAGKLFEDWRQNESQSPLLMLVGESGSGRSTLAGHWLQQIYSKQRTPPLVVHWRFGGQDGRFSRLIDELLHFFKVRMPASATLSKKTDEVIQHLTQTETLLLLDDVDRLLWLQPTETEADSLLDSSGEWASLEIEKFMAVLLHPNEGQMRTVVTCSTMPKPFWEVEQVVRLRMPALDSTNAGIFLKRIGFSQKTPHLDKLIAYLGGHPFALQLLATWLRVEKNKMPADIAAFWRRTSQQPIPARQTHLLQIVMNRLPKRTKYWLRQVVNLDRLLFSRQSITSAFGETTGEILLVPNSVLASLVHDGLLRRVAVGDKAHFELPDMVRTFVENRFDWSEAASSPAGDTQLLSRKDPKEILSREIVICKRLQAAGQFQAALTRYRAGVAPRLKYQFGAHLLTINLLAGVLAGSQSHHLRLASAKTQAWVIEQLGTAYLAAGKPIFAHKLLAKSVSIWQTLGETRLAANLMCEQAQALMWQLRFKAADEILREADGLCRQIGDQSTRSKVQNWRALLLALIGDFDGAAALLDQAFTWAKSSKNLLFQSEVWLHGAAIALLRKRSEPALASLKLVNDSLALSGMVDVESGILWARYFWLLGWAEVESGLFSEAKHHLQKAERRAANLKMPALQAKIWLSQARMWRRLAKDSPEVRYLASPADLQQRAWVDAGKVQRIAQENKLTWLLAEVHHFMAGLAADAGNEELAQSHARQKRHFREGEAQGYILLEPNSNNNQ